MVGKCGFLIGGLLYIYKTLHKVKYCRVLTILFYTFVCIRRGFYDNLANIFNLIFDSERSDRN